MPQKPCPGCGEPLRQDVIRGARSRFYGCWTCWHRLPPPLRQEYLAASQETQFGGGYIPPLLRDEIEQWWADNPPVPPEPSPPAWKRHPGTT